ncbi:MAG: site-2 protease family protein [Victivallales bacterium]|nr:site-2 protease family protein [Victivallales bacterium]
MPLFIQSLFNAPVYYFTWILFVMFSICAHEFAHAATADSLGDRTPRMLGYMSLDPRKTMGGSAILCLLLFGITWGAVPITRENLRRAWHASLIALAGPAANFALLLLFAALSSLVSKQETLQRFFATGCQVNSLLAIFNLLPIPGLDGWAALSSILPPLQRIPSRLHGAISLAGLLAIWFTPLHALLWRAILSLHIWAMNLIPF